MKTLLRIWEIIETHQACLQAWESLVFYLKFSCIPFKKKKHNKPNKNRFIACLHFYPLLLNYSEKLEGSYMQKRMKRGSRGEKRNHKMINKVPLKEGHNHTL